jgi:anti-sigma28 factor (negative regulator of flagellin synthesis)
MVTMSYRNLVTTTQPSIGPTTAALAQIRSAANVPADSIKIDKSSGPGSTQNDQSTFSYASGLLNEALVGSNDRTVDVEALQQAIGAGSYKVSSSDLADKLINTLIS